MEGETRRKENIPGTVSLTRDPGILSGFLSFPWRLEKGFFPLAQRPKKGKRRSVDWSDPPPLLGPSLAPFPVLARLFFFFAFPLAHPADEFYPPRAPNRH